MPFCTSNFAVALILHYEVLTRPVFRNHEESADGPNHFLWHLYVIDRALRNWGFSMATIWVSLLLRCSAICGRISRRPNKRYIHNDNVWRAVKPEISYISFLVKFKFVATQTRVKLFGTHIHSPDLRGAVLECIVSEPTSGRSYVRYSFPRKSTPSSWATLASFRPALLT